MSSEDSVKWLREQIERVKRNAQQALADPHTSDGHGVRIIGGKLAIMPSAASDRLTLHLVTNGPQDVIARCEAELAILGEHIIAHNQRGDALCFTCTDGPYPCRTVHLLASAYRHQPGWAEYWPEAVA